MATARTRTNKVVHISGEFAPGTYVDAIIEQAAPSHLMGRLT